MISFVADAGHSLPDVTVNFTRGLGAPLNGPLVVPTSPIRTAINPLKVVGETSGVPKVGEND